MKSKLINVVIYGILAISSGVMAFYIVYNAHWLINDDAVIIAHTGWGHYFHPEEEIFPQGGRMLPFIYLIYNILAFFGLSSVTAHFSLQMIVFILFCATSLIACYLSIKSDKMTCNEHVLVVSAVLICMARAYMPFLDGFTTLWEDYTMVVIWLICSYFVHTSSNRRVVIPAAIIGWVMVSYMTFCLETNLIFPLSYGILGILFYKKTSKIEKAYFWSLIGTAIGYLVLYYFIVYVHIETIYDPAHSSGATLVGNAIAMFVAQKVLWVVLPLVIWRAVRVISKKEETDFGDLVLLTGCAYCCGCAVLKLNWVVYYSLAVIYMVPAVAYNAKKYFGVNKALLLMIVLALFLFRRVPYYISNNQNERKETKEKMEFLLEELHQGNTLYWYAPYEDETRTTDGDVDWIEWMYFCTKTQIGYIYGDENYELPKVAIFDNHPGVYLLPSENNDLFEHINDTIISRGELIDGKLRSCNIVKIK